MIIQILKVTKTNLNVIFTWLRSTMESGTGAIFAHLTLYRLKFSTVRQSTNTKILAVSMLTGAQSWCL